MQRYREDHPERSWTWDSRSQTKGDVVLVVDNFQGLVLTLMQVKVRDLCRKRREWTEVEGGEAQLAEEGLASDCAGSWVFAHFQPRLFGIQSLRICSGQRLTLLGGISWKILPISTMR